MKTADVLKEFEEAGALMRGHFVLSSGLHSAADRLPARLRGVPPMKPGSRGVSQ